MKPIQVFPDRILAVDRDKSLIYKVLDDCKQEAYPEKVS